MLSHVKKQLMSAMRRRHDQHRCVGKDHGGGGCWLNFKASSGKPRIVGWLVVIGSWGIQMLLIIFFLKCRMK